LYVFVLTQKKQKLVKGSCWDTFEIVELFGMLTRVESKVREYY